MVFIIKKKIYVYNIALMKMRKNVEERKKKKKLWKNNNYKI
jgi:hypothetical protein